MTNRLTKATNVQYIAATPGSPGYAGQQYQNGYTSYWWENVCGWTVDGMGVYQWVQDTNPQSPTYLQWLQQLPPGETVAYIYSCKKVWKPYYVFPQPYIAPIPAVPATLAQFIYDYNLGWNAGAVSAASFDFDGYVLFEISLSLTGVVAGLNDVNVDAGYRNIDHGFYISNSVARITENDSIKAYLGPVVSTDIFKIDRRGGVVTYYINDVLKYTSLIPSSGKRYLDVSLYSGGDYVTNPVVAGYSSGYLSMSNMQANGSIDALPPTNFIRDAREFLAPSDSIEASGGALLLPTWGSAAISFRPLEAYGSIDAISANNYARDTRESLVPVDSIDATGGTLLLLPTWGSAYLSLQPLQAYGSVDARATVFVRATNEYLYLTESYAGSVQQSCALSMEPMTAIGFGSPNGQLAFGGQAILSMEPMTVESHPGELAPSYAIGAVVFPGLTLAATGSSGGFAAHTEVSTTVNADGTITVFVYGNPGTTVTITFPNGETYTYELDGTGMVSVTSVGVQPTDLPLTVTSATQEGVTQTFSITYNSGDESITISGTGGEPGATITITFPDNLSQTVIVDSTGAWTATSDELQPIGTTTFVVSSNGYISMTPMTVLGFGHADIGATTYGAAAISFEPLQAYGSIDEISPNNYARNTRESLFFGDSRGATGGTLLLPTYGNAALSFQPLQAYGSIDVVSTNVYARDARESLFPSDSIEATGGTLLLPTYGYAALSFLPPQAYGSIDEISANNYARDTREFLVPSDFIDATGGTFVLPTYGAAALSLQPLQAYGSVDAISTNTYARDTREFLVFAESLGAGADWSAAHFGGSASLSLRPLSVTAHALEGNTNASMRELSLVSGTMTFFAYAEVELYSTVTGTSTMVVLKLADAAMISSATGTPTMTYSAILQALMSTLVEVTAGVPVLSEDGEVWVVNAETEASSMYEDFSFNSFGKIGSKYYGAKSDGIYLLEGDDDAGDPIRASISLGKKDFGSTVEKRVPNAYIGVAASGNIYLRVIANGVTSTYVTNRSDDYLRTQRLKLGRGIKATHLTFELYNESGADFELDTVEFEVVDLTRRI